MRNMSPPPHKQDNGQDHTHQAMNQRMHRDNDHDRAHSAKVKEPESAMADAPVLNDSAEARAGRPVSQHKTDEDRRGYEKSYQRARNDTGRFDRSVHDIQKDGRYSRDT